MLWLGQCFSKCGARPTGGAQRCDRWVANGRDEREIIIIYFFNKCFGPQTGIEPGFATEEHTASVSERARQRERERAREREHTFTVSI